MTRIVLERSIVVGDTRVSALVRQSVQPHATAHFAAFTADKRPVAVLLQRGDRLEAFTPAGGPMAADDIERLCPGGMAQFLSLAPAPKD